MCLGDGVSFLLAEGEPSSSSIGVGVGKSYVCSSILSFFTRCRSMHMMMIMIRMITRKLKEPPAMATMVVRLNGVGSSVPVPACACV